MDAFQVADEGDALLVKGELAAAQVKFEQAGQAELPSGEDPDYWHAYWDGKHDAIEDILSKGRLRPQPTWLAQFGALLDVRHRFSVFNVNK